MDSYMMCDGCRLPIEDFSRISRWVSWDNLHHVLLSFREYGGVVRRKRETAGGCTVP